MGLLDDIAERKYRQLQQRRPKRSSTGGSRSGTVTPSASASVPQPTATASSASTQSSSSPYAGWTSGGSSASPQTIELPNSEEYNQREVFKYMHQNPPSPPKKVSQSIVLRGKSLWLPSDDNKSPKFPVRVLVRGPFNNGQILPRDRGAYLSAVTNAITNYSKTSLETDLQAPGRRSAFVAVTDANTAHCEFVHVGGKEDDAWMRKKGQGWFPFEYETVAGA